MSFTMDLTPPKDEEGFEDYTAKGRNDWFRARELTVMTTDSPRRGGRRLRIGVRSGRIPDNDPLVLDLSAVEAADLAAGLLNEIARDR